jgi:Domain of unknown function (DUF4263)
VTALGICHALLIDFARPLSGSTLTPVPEGFFAEMGEGGPGDLSVEQESIRRSVAAPGVTLVLGAVATGKTALAVRAARDLPPERVFFVRGRDAGSLGEVERMVRARGRADASGTVVIVDGLDELSTVPSLEQLTRFVQAPWLDHSHVLLTSRAAPAGIRELFREADTPGRRYSIAELRWPYATLIDQLRASADRGPQDEGTVQAVITLLQSQALHPALERALRSAVQSRLAGDGSLAPDLTFMPDRNGHIRVIPSTGLESAGLEITSGRAITATPRVVYRATRGFWLPEAAELEELINDPAVRERDLQEFFERHPHLLAGASYDKVIAHPVLARDQDGPLIPDFMLEPAGGGFADVMDLKLPRVRLVAGRNDRLRLTAHVAEAIAQVREYRAYFEDSAQRQAVQDRYGLQAYRPTAAVLIGRDPGPGPDKFELKRLLDELPGHVKLITYDDLLRQVRNLGQF